jgi:thermitase
MSFARSFFAHGHRWAASAFILVFVLAPATPVPMTAVVAAAAEDELYPHEQRQVQRGQQMVTVNELKTTRTARGREAVADRIIVKFVGAMNKAEWADIQNGAKSRGAGAATILPAEIGPHSHLVDVTGAASLEVAAQAFAADGRVRYAGPDEVFRTADTPDDTRLTEQWGLPMIQAPQAWNRTHGSAAKVIAIMDTGIRESHPDLAGKVIDRRDFTHWLISVDPDDKAGHGTHVAGIAAAVTNNSLGVAGLGYASRLINAKVMADNSKGSSSMLARGIYWATDAGAHVINMSLEFDVDCDPNIFEGVADAGINELRDAINHAWAHNIVLVAAAGNTPGSGQLAPGACPHVLSVANTNEVDALAPGNSNSGSWVDVAAPGQNILSTTIAGGTRCVSSARYGMCSGTSMSSALVSGLAALVQSSCLLTDPNAVVGRITGNADEIPGTGSNWQYGRVNALRSVCFPAPKNLRVGTIGSGSIQLLWDESTPGETYFQVGHRVTGTSSWSYTNRSTDPSSTHSWTHTGLSGGTSYDHMVRSCDADGCSAFSGVVTAIAGYGKLSVSLQGWGKVISTPAGINCGMGTTDCSQQYPPGTFVRLSAGSTTNPDTGVEWQFDHWEGASCPDAEYPICEFTMGGSRVVRAVFVKE